MVSSKSHRRRGYTAAISAARPDPRPSSHWRPVRVLLACVAIATVAACSGDGGDPGGLSPSALADAREQLLATPSPPDIEAYDLRMYEIMFSCMKEAGLEWMSYTPSPGLQASLGLTDEEFRRQFGWGTSTLIDVYVPEADVLDPNQVYAMGLPPEQQDAYGRQYGLCRQRVEDEIGLRPGTVQLDQATHEAYQAAVNSANADPRLADAKAAYATCMAERGYQANSGEDINAMILDRFQDYQTRFQNAASEWAQQGRDRAALQLSDVFTEDEIRDIREIQQYELAASWADWECGQLLYPVADALEQEYVEKFLNGES